MRFARFSFSVAGWWGLLSLTPLFFMYRLVGEKNPPALTHPEYYFGFLCVTMAWQIAFLLIARSPLRHRALMAPAFIEKFGYAGACLLLTSLKMAAVSTAFFGMIDFCFGVLFLISWMKCRGQHEGA
jgi:hypothetical protein